jgi:hypothetical protein
MTAMPAISQAQERGENRGSFRNSQGFAASDVSHARDRYDYDSRGRANERYETYRPSRSRIGFGRYAAPRGYWDHFGVWHPYGWR